MNRNTDSPNGYRVRRDSPLFRRGRAKKRTEGERSKLTIKMLLRLATEISVPLTGEKL